MKLISSKTTAFEQKSWKRGRRHTTEVSVYASDPAALGSIPGVPPKFPSCQGLSTALLLRAVDSRGLVASLYFKKELEETRGGRRPNLPNCD